MNIHKKARRIVRNLEIPSPIKKFFCSQKCKIDLSSNTNPHLGSFSHYPDVIQENLKELYLQHILTHPQGGQVEHRYVLSGDNVLFTVGSLEGIDLLLRTFGEPNQDIICLPQPTFPAYEHWGRLHNLIVKKVPLEGEDFNHLPLKKVSQLNPCLTFIPNPNNPVGTSLPLAMVEDLCKSVEGLVVIDEAYIEFSALGSCLSLLSRYPNLVILRTFSKAWGLAGLRCGVILADRLVINTLRRTQLPFGFSTFAQEKVRQCLENPVAAFQSWERIKASRDKLISELTSLKAVLKVFKSDTNFICLTLKNFNDTLALLEKEKILVLDCSDAIPNSIRVSVGSEQENQAFLDVMSSASLPL